MFFPESMDMGIHGDYSGRVRPSIYQRVLHTFVRSVVDHDLENHGTLGNFQDQATALCQKTVH